VLTHSHQRVTQLWNSLDRGEVENGEGRTPRCDQAWAFLKAVIVSANSAIGLRFRIEISQSVSDAEQVILHETSLACVNLPDRYTCPKRLKYFYRMYTSVIHRKLEGLSLETILTVLYTIRHILVQIAGPCLLSTFATFVPLELTPLSRGYVMSWHFTSFTSCWTASARKPGRRGPCSGCSHRRYCNTLTRRHSGSNSYHPCQVVMRYTSEQSRGRVHALVAVMILTTSTLTHAVVVVIALHQRFVRGRYTESCATHT
jgi:hypothetical protein